MLDKSYNVKLPEKRCELCTHHDSECDYDFYLAYCTRNKTENETIYDCEVDENNGVCDFFEKRTKFA